MAFVKVSFKEAFNWKVVLCCLGMGVAVGIIKQDALETGYAKGVAAKITAKFPK